MKNLILLLAALFSLNVFASNEALELFDITYSRDGRSVEVSYNLPCGILKEEIQEVVIFSAQENTHYVGLTIPTNAKYREIFCTMEYSPETHVFNLENKMSSNIEIIND